eukprot:SAG11_NODE_756_length_7324_cov_13.486505_2_plen_55_part_00
MYLSQGQIQPYNCTKFSILNLACTTVPGTIPLTRLTKTVYNSVLLAVQRTRIRS